MTWTTRPRTTRVEARARWAWLALALAHTGCEHVEGAVTEDAASFTDTFVDAAATETWPDFALPSARQTSRYSLAVADAFPRLKFDDPVAMARGGGRVFVVERAGRIYSFEERDDAGERTRVLDLSKKTAPNNDSGMLAIALHPEWGVQGSPNHAYFYVYYARVEEPLAPDAPQRTPHVLRLSRFTLSADGTADPQSELVLIEQEDRHLWHQGGGLLFNPRDGFLYLSIGDEGGNNCRYDHCQRIDRSLFGGVLRIDVDMRGGEISHPIRTQPENGTTDHYYVPNDNPFVDEPDVLEELYAIGLRNPYRMSYDPVDDLTFIADVGEHAHEEVDVLGKGANFQWDVMEGDEPAELPPDPELPRLGVWTDPVQVYTRKQATAIIGGLVYRGSRLPSLYGRYLHGDFRTGNLFALQYGVRDGVVTVEDSEVVLETRFEELESGITSFTEGRDGELYLTTMGDGVPIRRVEQDAIYDDDAPRMLSQTHLFRDLRTLEPAPGLVEYDVNVPLWSDGARKRRFIAVPEGERAHAGTGRAWDLPEGTVLVKHFDLPLDARRPDRLRPLETRVLRVDAQGVHGATYVWRADGGDAELLLEHREQQLEVTDAAGETQVQVHVYPSPQECLRCHNPEAGDALGVRTAQLDRGDQLKRLIDAGVVAEDGLRARTEDQTAMVALDDDAAPLERRIRSYLDANCAYCHGTVDMSGVRWDARMATALPQAGILDGPVRDGEDAQRVVKPGAPELSAMFLRASSEDPETRMPPLGTTRPDPTFVAQLRAWIESLPPED